MTDKTVAAERTRSDAGPAHMRRAKGTASEATVSPAEAAPSHPAAATRASTRPSGIGFEGEHGSGQ